MKDKDRELEQVSLAAREANACNIDLDVAREEGTWYSVIDTIALSMGSGVGIPLPADRVNEVLRSMGKTNDDLPLKNPRMLQAFWKSGAPHLQRQWDLWNLDTWRWNPDSFDDTLVPQAQGWSIIAESQCARLFAIPQSAENVSPEMRDEWRTHALALCALAQAQCEFAFGNLRNDEGLFVTAARPGSIQVTEPAANLADQACMLWAISSLAHLTGEQDLLRNDDVQRNTSEMADDLFQAILNNKDSLVSSAIDAVKAQSVAVQALVWYAAVTEAQDLRASALWMLREFADNLVRAQDRSEAVGNSLPDAAAALRGLIEAFRVTRLRTYAESAAKVFNYMESQWWVLAGTYATQPLASEYTYNADDVGGILGALNASRLFLGDRVDKALAELRMRMFFCKAVNTSGLQMSMPSAAFLPEWLQQREPSEHFRFPAIPLPQQAGGDHGIAPSLAGEVSYDPQADEWARRMTCDVPAAMHACCEFMWVNCDLVNGFPEIKLEGAPVAVRQAAGVEAGT